ncbi:alpha/beta fold hydrolase [Neisseriaceae bacterium PsAf]|nr:alpha/beta fold hydrolase [Neisseriaceae bacterium PsAf]
MSVQKYQEKYKSTSIWYKINKLSIHVRHWERQNKPKLLLLHGWMDASASFQFIVDNLSPEWDIYAMDWRGMGLSEHILYGYYDITMMISDLSQLVDLISPQQPIHILGHSLGGMLLSLYAGIAPHRVKSLVLAEEFGVSDESEEKSVQRMKGFLQELSHDSRRSKTKNRDHYIQKLMKDNPLLSYEKALYLSHFLLRDEAGHLKLSADIKHRISQPFPYNLAFYEKFWKRITSPVLWMQGDFVAHNSVLNGIKDSLEQRYELLGSPERVVLKGAGHMIHWEASEDMADATEKFLLETI